MTASVTDPPIPASADGDLLAIAREQVLERGEPLTYDQILAVLRTGDDELEAWLALAHEGGGRDARVIALTGWGQEADRQRSRAAGVDGHLVKPVDLQSLMEVM